LREYSDLSLSLSAGKKARVCEAYACALVLSGRRAKKPIHDGSQKNELNCYVAFNVEMEPHFSWPHNENKEKESTPDGAGIKLKIDF
jgi:hypothetical protein